MTTEVQITNKDKARTIEVRSIDYDKETRREARSVQMELKPGESGTLYCHLLRDLLIVEKKP